MAPRCPGGRGGPGPHVLALRALQGRQGRGDGRRRLPRTRALGLRHRCAVLGPRALAHRVRVAQLHGGSPDLSDLGTAGDGGRRHILGERCADAPDGRGESGEHQMSPGRDGEPVPDPGAGDDVTRIAVVGGGAWGTALADLLARKGDAVTLWAREPEVVEAVNRQHANPVFLPGASLAPALRAEGDLVAAVRGAEVVVSAAPAHAVRPVMTLAAAAFPQGGKRPLVVSVSKGLDPERLERPSSVLEDVLPPGTPVAVLSGPSFAQEVYERQPTAVVAAAADHGVAQRAQRVFSVAYFRVYSHTDVVGVELAGALKNGIAIAAGPLPGVGPGYH